MHHDHARVTRMVPLLERGQEAFRLRCALRPKSEQQFYGTISVVTQADFGANALLCLAHAVHDGPVHILCDDGAMFALLTRLTRR